MYYTDSRISGIGISKQDIENGVSLTVNGTTVDIYFPESAPGVVLEIQLNNTGDSTNLSGIIITATSGQNQYQGTSDQSGKVSLLITENGTYDFSVSQLPDGYVVMGYVPPEVQTTMNASITITNIIILELEIVFTAPSSPVSHSVTVPLEMSSTSYTTTISRTGFKTFTCNHNETLTLDSLSVDETMQLTDITGTFRSTGQYRSNNSGGTYWDQSLPYRGDFPFFETVTSESIFSMIQDEYSLEVHANMDFDLSVTFWAVMTNTSSFKISGNALHSFTLNLRYTSDDDNLEWLSVSAEDTGYCYATSNLTSKNITYYLSCMIGQSDFDVTDFKICPYNSLK